MKKSIFCIAALLCACVPPNVYCQASFTSGYRPVEKGEKVPAISLSIIQNDISSTIPLSSLQGKLVILDFWGINCSPCIKAFPKLMDLQNKFKKEIQIILVNSASRHYLDSIIKKRSEISRLYKIPDLPQVTSDTVLGQLFPHLTIPHYVWIDGKGKLLTNTGDRELSEENIKAVLQFKGAKFFEKKDFLSYNDSLPMIPQLFTNQPDPLQYYSCVTKWMQGFGSGDVLITDSLKNTVRLSRPPLSLLMLLSDALTKHKVFNDPYQDAAFDYGKRVIMEVQDSNRYFYNRLKYKSIEDWKSTNHFGYEGVFPLSEKVFIYDFMLADLCRFFQIDVTLTKKKVKCLALVRTSDTDKIKYKGGYVRGNPQIFTDTLGVVHLLSTRLNMLRNWLSAANRDKAFIFVDHTNYTKNVGLEIHSPLDDIEALRKELNSKYDLDLIETETEVEFMVIRDKVQVKSKG